MRSSAVRKLKRKEEGNIAAIRRADESLFDSAPDKRWLFENRLLIIKLSESAVRSLSEVKSLPSEHGEPRIMNICRKTVSDGNFALDESAVIAEINDYQKSNSYLTVGELLWLSAYFHFVCVDTLADGIRAGTLEHAADAVRLMLSIRDIDFEHIYETVSYSESVLIRDPAGTYVRCDGATKSMYRRKLADISRRFRMGEYETSKLILKNAEDSEGRARHVGWHILKYSRHGVAAALYFPTLYLSPLLSVALLASLSFVLDSTSLLLASILSYLPLRSFVKIMLDEHFARSETPDILPRLSLDEIPQEGRTLVLYTVSLSGGSSDAGVFDRLATYASAYASPGLGFAVLADLPDSDAETEERDGRIIEYAKDRVADIINAGGEAYFFWRGRTYSENEGRYIGSERKRGAQAELFSLLSGGPSSLEVFGGEPKNFKYVLALDSDTEILLSDIKKLIATALHPCCAPVISRSSGYPIVTDGYGVIAPTAQVSKSDTSSEKLYTVYRYAYGGRSEYERSSFSAYSYLFGIGSFCGKGLIDIEAYMKTVYGAFPRERILSHDTAEGVRLRCGHASDLRVYDGVPRDYLRERSRAHRWIRGDIQATVLLRRGVPSVSGERYKNPVGTVGRLIMFEPVTEALTAVVRPAAIVLSLLGGTPLGAVVFVSAVADRLYKAAKLAVGSFRIPYRRYLSLHPNYIKTSLFEIFFGLSSTVDTAVNSADGIYRAFYRMKFSKKRLLEWKTAASADAERGGGAKTYLLKMWQTVLVGAVTMFSAFIANGASVIILPLYGASWIIFPMWMHRLGDTDAYVAHDAAVDGEARRGLLRDVDKMWRFFADNVTAKYNFLPPDNISVFPEPKTAERTSPTNIGMYLLSAVNAHDLGLISLDELKTRLENTLSTVEKLDKWNGHLYNWYDIRTLAVLYPAYVSTVDSGNLLICLLTVKNAVKVYDGFEQIVGAAERLVGGADLSVLYNKKRGLFYIGYNSALGQYDKNVYDLYAGEILTTGFFAVARGDVPSQHWASLGRVRVDEDGIETMLSWSGSAFEFFMPAIFLPAQPGTARYETLASAALLQREDFVMLDGKMLYGRSESSFYDFDDSVNYAYKAHGCDALAISPDIKRENVLSPYSLYLISQFDAKAAEALVPHRDGELYGKYGFYESVDATRARVGSDYGVAQLYMAHHIGMSISSSANLLLSGINVRRFCSEPFIRASLPLLNESISVNRRRAEERYRIRVEAHMPETEEFAEGTISSDSAVISNGRTKVMASKDGGIVVYDGQTLLTQPIRRGCAGVTALVRVGNDIFSCLTGSRVQFSTDGVSVVYKNEFVSEDKLIRTELTVTVSPSSPAASFDLTVSGDRGATDALFICSPVINSYGAYIASPAYSDLFVTSEETEPGVVRFSRKISPGERREIYFRVTHDDGDLLTVHTKKDAILPFRYTDEDVVSVFDAAQSRTDGACVHPVFAAVVSGADVRRIGVVISADGPDLSASADARPGMEKLLRLRAALSGADQSAVRCAMTLAGSIADLTPNVTGIVSSAERAWGDVKFRRDLFWRSGISGDLPVVTVFTSDLTSSADVFAVEELIGAKRFLFLSGVRFDLVFISPASGYMSGGTGKLRRILSVGGSEKLMGKTNGIFIVDRESLSAEEELMFMTSSCYTVDIGAEHPFTVSKPELPANDVADTREGNKAPISFSRDENGIIIENGKNASPWSMVYANAVFGTLLTNLTCGYSWYANSSLSTISARHADPLLGTPGEVCLLVIDGVGHDLARSASVVRWERGCAVYRGEVSGVGYELRVGTDAKLPAKLYHIRVENGGSNAGIRAELLYYPPASAVCSDGRIVLTSEAAASVSTFAVSDEIGASAVNRRDHIMARSALFAGECGFVIAAYPRSSVCLKHIRDKFRRSELIPRAFEEYEARADRILNARVYDGDAGFLRGGLLDSVSYQVFYVRMLARSGYSQSGGAFGFRDQLQDSLAALYFSPEITKYQILRSCARQYEDGRVQHWWHAFPYGGGLRTRCSDDYMWLPYVAAEYVLSLNDPDILKFRLPFLVSSPLGEGEIDRYERAAVSERRATVLEHCIAAVGSSFERGAHGLPLIGSGDWNDGMSEVGIKGRGESVWLAFFFAVVYRRFSELLTKYGIDPILAERLMYEADTLVTAAEVTSWDGGWYVRAFDDDGTPLGSDSCEECRIDLLPQAFSVFASAQKERSSAALDNVMKYLYDEKYGILRLFAPSYDKAERHGYICRYPAGIRENGGQYTHGALFCAAAMFAAGKRDLGIKLLTAFSPYSIYAGGRMEGNYTAEPYFLAADVYYGDGVTGHSGWTGYTGSAGWYYRVVLKYYLGISLRDGCVDVAPAGDASCEVSVRAGGCEFDIVVSSDEKASADGADAVYTVRTGDRVTLRPSGEKKKIFVKVAK